MQKGLKTFDNLSAHPCMSIVAGGVIFLFGIVLTDIPSMIMSSGWPATEGNITTCRLVGTSVREWTGDLYTERHAFIRYQYIVNGSRYSSAEINSIHSPFHLYPASYASRYPIGKDVMVYYNPRDPTEAVLEPGFVDVFKTFDAISLAFFGVGIYLIFLGIKGLIEKRNKSYEYDASGFDAE